MVVFACNACGQSVKKNQVEKHCTTQCRNCESLSCMDCGKDFWGEEYQNHNKCITEEAKYSGPDYKESPNARKGEKKQEMWIQHIQNVMAGKQVDKKLKAVLGQLLTFENIPRKQKKFQKFAENSLKIYDTALVESTWKLFAEAQASMTKSNGTDDKKATDATENGKSAEAEETVNETEAVNGKKKKDKKKKTEEMETKDETIDEKQTSEEKTVEGVTNTQEDLSSSGKKKKKKKKKNKKKDDDAMEVDGKEDKTPVEEQLVQKAQKRQHEEVAQSPRKKFVLQKFVPASDQNVTKESTDVAEAVDAVKANDVAGDGQTSAKKKKNKKSKKNKTDDEKVSIVHKATKDMGTPEVVVADLATETKAKPEKFRWSETIEGVIRQASEGKGNIHLKKLRKKVFKLYKASQGEAAMDDKFTKKFEDKIKSDKFELKEGRIYLAK